MEAEGLGNSTTALIEDEISLTGGNAGNSSEEGAVESTQLSILEEANIQTSRNGIFENASFHEIDLSTPLCGYDSAMPRTTEQQSIAFPFARRLTCITISCLLTLVLACVLLITGKKVLQRFGGGLFGVSVVLCVMAIIEGLMHGPDRQRSQSGDTERQTVPETPLNFDLSQARTEWLMSTIEVDDKDKPPSYNMVIRAPMSSEKPGEGSKSYFMHFPTNLFSTTDCENCEDITNPPPSYESILDLISPSSQRNTIEEQPITITCAESPREHVARNNTGERDVRAVTLPEHRSREVRATLV